MSDYKFRCDRCKLNYYSNDLHKDWKGRIVCGNCDLPKPAFLMKQPIIKEILSPKVVRPNTERPQAVPEQDGVSTWNGVYLTQDGYKFDITWNEWNTNWNE